MSKKSTPSPLPMTDADIAALPPLIPVFRLWTDGIYGSGLLPISSERGARLIADGVIKVVPLTQRRFAIRRADLIAIFENGLALPAKPRRRKASKAKAAKRAQQKAAAVAEREGAQEAALP
jgi:hypothetical protein